MDMVFRKVKTYYRTVKQNFSFIILCLAAGWYIGGFFEDEAYDPSSGSRHSRSRYTKHDTSSANKKLQKNFESGSQDNDDKSRQAMFDKDLQVLNRQVGYHDKPWLHAEKVLPQNMAIGAFGEIKGQGLDEDYAEDNAVAAKRQVRRENRLVMQSLDNIDSRTLRLMELNEEDDKYKEYESSKYKEGEDIDMFSMGVNARGKNVFNDDIDDHEAHKLKNDEERNKFTVKKITAGGANPLLMGSLEKSKSDGFAGDFDEVEPENETTNEDSSYQVDGGSYEDDEDGEETPNGSPTSTKSKGEEMSLKTIAKRASKLGFEDFDPNNFENEENKIENDDSLSEDEKVTKLRKLARLKDMAEGNFITKHAHGLHKKTLDMQGKGGQLPPMIGPDMHGNENDMDLALMTNEERTKEMNLRAALRREKEVRMSMIDENAFDGNEKSNSEVAEASAEAHLAEKEKQFEAERAAQIEERKKRMKERMKAMMEARKEKKKKAAIAAMSQKEMGEEDYEMAQKGQGISTTEQTKIGIEIETQIQSPLATSNDDDLDDFAKQAEEIADSTSTNNPPSPSVHEEIAQIHQEIIQNQKQIKADNLANTKNLNVPIQHILGLDEAAAKGRNWVT